MSLGMADIVTRHALFITELALHGYSL
ncbi:uncharacterized protein METZ01_LOCUS140642 [marine metagenome]|uniref:Uncharacterized protein n=1 Tax=marine metagenome TaxID=408172 RepID=A0A381ZEP5_9ZZZZ